MQMTRECSQDTTARLLTSLKILRNYHGCKLPAEVFGFPDELAAMGAARREMEGLGVTFREISSQPRPGQWKQFQIVSRSLVVAMRGRGGVGLLFSNALSRKARRLRGRRSQRSSTSILITLLFETLLYDNLSLIFVPYSWLKNICWQFLFDAPLYQENGVVLWPDISKDGGAPRFIVVPFHFQTVNSRFSLSLKPRTLSGGSREYPATPPSGKSSLARLARPALTRTPVH